MLTVYKASAGSGKTFQLVAGYLKLLMANPGNYRQILAVTFTNKATAEMKTRILEQLSLISGEGNSPYISLLKEELQLNEIQIRKLAYLALKNILHDYSRFSVSTIDAFAQRVIRAFNREMGISPHFILELDNDRILEEAVDRLLSKVDTDKQLRKWLVDFSREKIMENRSQQIETDIKLLGKELFKEKFQVFFPDGDGSVYTRDHLIRFKRELEKIIALFENTLQLLAAACIIQIKNKGFSPDDFLYKTTGVAGYLKNLSEKIIREPGARVLNAAESADKWFSKEHYGKIQLGQLVQNFLLPSLREIILFYNSQIVEYQSAIEVNKQLRILGILTDLKEEIKLLLQEQGIMQLSDSNLMLSKIIGESDSPFIYEKIGNRFNYYMLDEFQDTSLLQWNNFKPLIENALAQGNPVLLVGDVKQSIYRWRNSDWNILATQVNTDFPLHQPNLVSLDKNWRSRKNIIDFNNAIVGALTQTYEEALFDEFPDRKYVEKFRSVYLEFFQEPGASLAVPAGMAEISYLNEEEFDVNSARLLVEQVKKLQDKGIKASETAILIRKKDEGALIVETFMEAATRIENKRYNLSVLSNESLFLYASRGVNFIILLIELLTTPDAKIQKTALLYMWLTWLKPLQNGKSSFTGNLADREIFGELFAGSEVEAVFNSELQLKVNQIQEKISLSSLDETIMKICNTFQLFEIQSELPYLQTLIDQAAEIKLSLSNDLSSFLFWWNSSGCNTSVNVNEEVDSVRLLTIHKSKGLEFEAVLLPFFNFDSSWSGNLAPVLWCRPSVEPFCRFPLLPVKACSRLSGTIFREDYLEEKVSSFIDSLNLVYVAFTRAKSALFVNCKKPADKKNGGQGKTLNALLETALDKISSDGKFSQCWNQEKTVFTLGELPVFVKIPSVAEGNFVENYTFSDFSNRIQLRLKSEDFLITDVHQQSVKNTGKLVHDILSWVQVKEDLEKACTKALNEGFIDTAGYVEIREKLINSMEHPEIKRWFDGSYNIINERNLLTPGKILRPDRVMISGTKAIVADYKWGEVKQDIYHVQVSRYAEVLRKCGFEKVEGFIWYINIGEVEKVGEWE